MKESLERDTGRTRDAWAEILRRDCPETTPRGRQKWLKETHGLGVNRAAQILDAAFPQTGWNEPDALRAALWKDPDSAAILTEIEAAIASLADVTPTQRKGYSAWSRKVQLAAAKPIKGGKVLLGLALTPNSDTALESANGREGWSERLRSKITLCPADQLSDKLKPLLAQAHRNS